MANTLHTTAPTVGLATVEKARSENAGLATQKIPDSMWRELEIIGDRWNKSFPYRLAVYERNSDGSGYKESDQIPAFILPIAPEALSISTPYAITTTATLGGIVEEHNGAPFKFITLSGTTGVMPLKGAVAPNALLASPVSSIFAGTASGINSIITNAKNLTGLAPAPPASMSTVEVKNNETSTGYYQFKLLERFLDVYVATKKTAKGKQLVLAFEIWKDNQFYLVSPVSFNLTRSAQSPLEYQYSLQLKAWKRVPSSSIGNFKVSYHEPVARRPNAIAQVSNALTSARRVLEGVRRTLQGVRGDIDNTLFRPIREATLFCKDTVSTSLSAADLPAGVITDLKGPLLQAFSLKTIGTDAWQQLDASGRRLVDAWQQLAVQVGTASSLTGTPDSTLTIYNRDKQGLSERGGSPVNKMADHPEDYYDFWSAVPLNKLQIPNTVQRRINQELDSVRALRREDFEQMRDNAAELLADFEAAVGAGNSTYNLVFGSRPTNTRTPSANEYEAIYALNDVIAQFDSLAASSTIDRDQVSSMEYVAGLASRSGIAFQVPTSKFLVPFPYGATLEQLSLQYLGTPDRWMEIATLNGLQNPYVDEVGFSLSLLTNGNGTHLLLPFDTRITTGQTVWVGADNQSPVKAIVERVEPSGTNMIVTIDTAVAGLTTAEHAYLRTFTPNTVNSQQSLYIPSSETVDEEDWQYKEIPGVNYLDPMVRAGGIDLLLTADGDLVVTPDGDGRLAIGLTNIVQKIRLALGTPKGSLLHHPEYGFPVLFGASTADVSAQDVLRACRDLFKDDPTFDGVTSASVVFDGPVAIVTVQVRVAGVSQLLPVTVRLGR